MCQMLINQPAAVATINARHVISLMLRVLVAVGLEWIVGFLLYFWPENEPIYFTFIILVSFHGLWVLLSTLSLENVRSQWSFIPCKKANVTSDVTTISGSSSVEAVRRSFDGGERRGEGEMKDDSSEKIIESEINGVQENKEIGQNDNHSESKMNGERVERSETGESWLSECAEGAARSTTGVAGNSEEEIERGIADGCDASKRPETASQEPQASGSWPGESRDDASAYPGGSNDDASASPVGSTDEPPKLILGIPRTGSCFQAKLPSGKLFERSDNHPRLLTGDDTISSLHINEGKYAGY